MKSGRSRRQRRGWIGGAVLIAVALVALVIPLPAGVVEAIYSRGIYLHIQRILTTASNVVPFALLDLAATLAVLAWLGRVTSVVRARSWPGLRLLLFQFAVFTGALYLVFLALWGLNYRRVPLEQKVVFDPSRITREAAIGMATRAVRLVNENFEGAHADAADGEDLARAFASAQTALGASTLARPGIPKRSLLGLYFRWAAIDGMTDPFFLEVIVNPDVLPVERPFVLAHEWGHLAGYADESEANFIAWLTCAKGSAAARYSGWLSLYGELSSALPREDRRRLAEQLEAGPRADLQAINARLLRSAPVVRRAARDVYDSYLKANRIQEGIASYDAVVRLVLGSDLGEEWTPRLRTP